MHQRALFAGFASLAAATFAFSLASAHVRLVYPTPRHATPAGFLTGSPADNGANIKAAPCGTMGDSRTTDTSRVTVLQPGATITVRFAETIDHPGFFRISFDNDGQDAFVAPTTRAMVQTAAPYTLPVLLDNITDQTGSGVHNYTAMVTLPNVECERCTLQVIEVMSAASSWMPDDIYYTCADIALRAGGAGGAGGTGGSGGSGGSGTSGGAAGASLGGAAGNGGFSAGGGAGAGTGGPGGGAGAGAAGAAAGGTGVPGGGAGGTTAPGGTGGAPAAGGAGTATGGTTAAGTSSTEPAATDEDGGCALGAARAPQGHAAWAAAVIALAVVVTRRRRGSRSAAA